MSSEKNYVFFKDKIKIEMPHAPQNLTFIEIKNDFLFYNEASKKKMYFISWEELNNLKSNDFENSILNKTFGPFYYKKYQVYYQ